MYLALQRNIRSVRFSMSTRLVHETENLSIVINTTVVNALMFCCATYVTINVVSGIEKILTPCTGARMIPGVSQH